jgi:hypothetical protein
MLNVAHKYLNQLTTKQQPQPSDRCLFAQLCDLRFLIAFLFMREMMETSRLLFIKCPVEKVINHSCRGRRVVNAQRARLETVKFHAID